MGPLSLVYTTKPILFISAVRTSVLVSCLFYLCRQEQRVSELEQQALALQTRIVELQKSPFAKSRQDDTLDDL